MVAGASTLQYGDLLSAGTGGPATARLVDEWTRGVQQTNHGDLKMVTEWSRLNFVIRNPYLPKALIDAALLRRLRYIYCVSREVPALTSTAPLEGRKMSEILLSAAGPIAASLTTRTSTPTSTYLEFGRGTIVIEEAPMQVLTGIDRRPRVVAGA